MIVVSGVMRSAGKSNRMKDLSSKAEDAKKEYFRRFGKKATHINLPKNLNYHEQKFAGLIVAKQSMSDGTVVVGHLIEEPFSAGRLSQFKKG